MKKQATVKKATKRQPTKKAEQPNNKFDTIISNIQTHATNLDTVIDVVCKRIDAIKTGMTITVPIHLLSGYERAQLRTGVSDRYKSGIKINVRDVKTINVHYSIKKIV
jgi:hypothetical protein